VCDTVREADGLAMSSRNVRLKDDDRTRALALWRGLQAAKHAIDAGERSAGAVATAGTSAMKVDGVEPEYFAVVDRASLAPLTTLAGDVLIAVAARVGPVRLIDNIVMRVS